MTDRVAVSIVIPARDEAARLPALLDAHRWADEIIVVDHGSTDDTAAIAAAAGARVVTQQGGTIADARNAGAAAARHDWILALDADEIADATLGAEIAAVVEAGVHQAYQIRRRNFYLGREQTRGAWGRDWIARLYRRPQQFTQVLVHESLRLSGSTGRLTATLRHETYRDLSHHLAKMDRYARWGAEELYARGKRAGVTGLVGSPLWRFVKAYFLNGHCLDGRFGLVTSLLGAQTAFLKYAHLWAIERERGA